MPAERQQQTNVTDAGLTATYSNKIYHPEDCIQDTTTQSHHYSVIDLETVDMDTHYHYYNHVELPDAPRQTISSRNMVPLVSQHVHIIPLDDDVLTTNRSDRRSQSTQTSNDRYNTIMDHYSTID